MEPRSRLLRFPLKSSLIFTQVDPWWGPAYCKRNWNAVLIKKEGSVVLVGVNELLGRALQAGAQTLRVNSPVYVGGIPQELQDSNSPVILEQDKIPARGPTFGHDPVPAGFSGAAYSNTAADLYYKCTC